MKTVSFASKLCFILPVSSNLSCVRYCLAFVVLLWRMFFLFQFSSAQWKYLLDFMMRTVLSGMSDRGLNQLVETMWIFVIIVTLFPHVLFILKLSFIFLPAFGRIFPKEFFYFTVDIFSIFLSSNCDISHFLQLLLNYWHLIGLKFLIVKVPTVYKISVVEVDL